MNQKNAMYEFIRKNHECLHHFVWRPRRSPDAPGNCKEQVPSVIEIKIKNVTS